MSVVVPLKGSASLADAEAKWIVRLEPEFALAVRTADAGWATGDLRVPAAGALAALSLSHPTEDVIGHNESLSSPYHREDVPALRTQTHSDFNHADMQIYRARLRSMGAC